ncbi:unnamed protein product, partial [Closterium sp. NIES-64]
MGTIVYRKMTLEEAKWKFPELRKVVRMGGECSPVEVPVTYGEVPGASDADVRERDEGAERATVDRPTPEEWNVDVQWEDVEELWSYDVHPTQGARPTSLASTLIMLVHAGANGNSHFIGGSTSWANTDTETGYHCERDKAELPSDQVDDVADAVIKDAEEWSDDSDEWWLAGHYDGEEVEVWVAGVQGLTAAVQGLTAGVQGLTAGVQGWKAGVQGWKAGVQGGEAGVQGWEAGVQGWEAGVQGRKAGVQAWEAVHRGYEGTVGYERSWAYEGSAGYERNGEYERSGGSPLYGMSGGYERSGEYERSGGYERSGEYERSGGYERSGEYERSGGYVAACR